MEKVPKVAVIIPVYNRERLIDETIKSVLAQTYPNIEVIAVDDGSTDNSRKVLESFGNKIRVLEHPGRVNNGQSAAINLGIRSTESEYVAILDSDDLFAPKKIERQVEYLQKKRNVGLVYCNGYYINEEGRVLYRIFPEGHAEKNNPEHVLLDCYFSLPSNSLIRRRAIEKAGSFDESMRSAQDHDMAIRLAEVTRLAYIDEPLWYYRRHPSSQSGVHAKRRWQVGFTILEKACKRYPYPKKIYRKRKAVLNFRMGQCFLEEKKHLNSLIHFLKAGIHDPVRSLKVIFGKEKTSSPHS
jgi:glycosyltransferase involved in cell wall biosynthesis